MAQTKQEMETDFTRLEEMQVDALVTGNPDTEDILAQVGARIEAQIEAEFVAPTRATRVTSIDSAEAELIAFENEDRVSRELKAAIQDSRSDLVQRRVNA